MVCVGRRGQPNVASTAGLQQGGAETNPSTADSGELTQHSHLSKNLWT